MRVIAMSGRDRQIAAQAKREQKHCILLWLCGAPSQFETWDPKPGTLGGGPFPAIRTKIPGVRVSSLMPKCASIMDKLAVVRSMSTKPSEHAQAINLLNRGAEPRQPFVRPILGSALGQALGRLQRLEHDEQRGADGIRQQRQRA